MEIVRLSEMPEEQRKQLDNHLKAMNYPLPRVNFDEFGLRYDINHLNEVGGAISLLPLDYAANYVDVVTKTKMDKGYPLPPVPRHVPENFKALNATAIGNIAYCIFKGKKEDPELVKYMEFYNAYQNWYVEQLGDLVKSMAK